MGQRSGGSPFAAPPLTFGQIDDSPAMPMVRGRPPKVLVPGHVGDVVNRDTCFAEQRAEAQSRKVVLDSRWTECASVTSAGTSIASPTSVTATVHRERQVADQGLHPIQQTGRFRCRSPIGGFNVYAAERSCAGAASSTRLTSSTTRWHVTGLPSDSTTSSSTALTRSP